MDLLSKKFAKIGVDNAPGQEGRQRSRELPLIGESIPGIPVDFSHGDVNAFEPVPGTLDTFIKGVQLGGEQAYTEYRGKSTIREMLLKNYPLLPVPHCLPMTSSLLRQEHKARSF